MLLHKWLFACLLVILPPLAPAAAPPPPTPRPFQGVVVGGRTLLTCERDYEHLVYTCVTLLDKQKISHRVFCAFHLWLPIRWYVIEGGFYPTQTFSCDLGYGTSELLQRLEILELLKGKAIPHSGTKHWSGGDVPLFTSLAPSTFARKIGLKVAFDYQLYSDYASTSAMGVRQFVLTNSRGKVEPRGKTDALVGYAILVSREDSLTPHWSFTSHSYQGKWDERKKEWEQRPWKKEEDLQITFKEPFHAFVKGEDYFFLTESGKLFVSPKPSKPGIRPVMPVWQDKNRPIRGFITDADTNRHFLFVPAKEKGGRPAFFDLSDKPKLQEYEPELVPLSKLKEPHRTIAQHARILVALKKIKPK